ncbi:hypothetical protein SLA2020_276020 [Shorea laevis]
MEDLDEQIGADIVAKALLAPANVGVDGDIVVEKTGTCDWRTGYIAVTCRYEDLLSAGFADPCRVSRCALQSAVSVADPCWISRSALQSAVFWCYSHLV